jgi:phage terminase small subunit
MPKVGEPNPNGIRLKPQQQKFLDNYLHKDMTQTAAARASGYNHPTVQAVQLLNNPVVRERMEEMRQELESKYGVNITKSVRDMQRLRDEAWAAGNFSAAIKAEELRLKVTGLMVSRTHVVHENVDSLNRDEIVAKLNEIVGRAKDRMVDVTPTENSTEYELIPLAAVSEEGVEDTDEHGEGGEGEEVA